MGQFNLFASVKLKEEIPVEDGGTAPEVCPDAIVEVFKDGEAYRTYLGSLDIGCKPFDH